MVPAIVYPGMQVSVGLNARKAPNYKLDNQMVVDLRIDGTSLDFEGWYDKETTLSHHEEAPVTGKVNTEARSASSSVSAFFRGAGYARNDTSTL